MKKYSLYFIVVLIVAAFTYTKSFTIKGKVIDETGAPVSDASILVKGTNNGTSTDSSGRFSIEVPGKNSILIITAAGIPSKEVRVTDKKELVVSLTRLTQHLAEAVVVTGYARKGLSGKAARVNISSSQGIQFTSPQIAKDEEVKDFIEAEGYNKQLYDSLRHNNNFNREGYDRIIENRFLKATDNPLSTFSIDVDAASYSNIRRLLNYNQLPRPEQYALKK